MTDYSRLEVGWFRARAEACLLYAQEADERADSLWTWIIGQRGWWRREASSWRLQQEFWNLLADELQAKGHND